MLRLRDTAGAAHELPDSVRFVELCDMQGAVARVFYVDDLGVHRILEPGTVDAQRYAKLMKTNFL